MILSLLIAAPRTWNRLPAEITSANSLLTFRRLLKHFVVQQSYRTLFDHRPWQPVVFAAAAPFGATLKNLLTALQAELVRKLACQQDVQLPQRVTVKNNNRLLLHQAL